MPPQRNRAGFCVSDGALSQGPTGVHLRESLGTVLNGGVWRPLCVPGQGVRWRKVGSGNTGCGSRGSQREMAKQNFS